MERPVLGTLLDTYNIFGRFELAVYYTACFGILPSHLKIELPLERSQETVDSILKSMDLQSSAFSPVFKKWSTEEKNDNPSNEYPVEQVFRSDSGRVIIHFVCYRKEFEIEFLYDIDRPDSEKWILETIRQLQIKFRAPKVPKFKVLVLQDGNFNTEDVNTADFNSIDINELYNDDFAQIDSIISTSMTRKESGIILLHGEPGTGKTTYIKHLISKHQKQEFIFIQNDFVKDLLKPVFISFLLQNKNSVLIIEDAEKVVVARENSTEDSVVSTILQLTDGLFSDFLNTKIICTFNTNLDRIDKALLRKGRMIAKYHFTRLSPEKTAALARKLGHDAVTGSLTLADIFEFDKQGFKDATKKAIGFIPS